MKVAIYMRVSTTRQTNLNQFIQLRKLAEYKGFQVVGVYRDVKSGKNVDRPAFQRMMSDASDNLFNAVLVYSPERLGRNFPESVRVVEELKQRGIHICSVAPAVDTTSPMGEAFFRVGSIFAEMERQALVERVHCGLERARKQGKKLGNPGVYQKHFDEVVELRSHGYSIREIAASVGIANGTVQKIITKHRSSVG